jgi:hypothetical protein
VKLVATAGYCAVEFVEVFVVVVLPVVVPVVVVELVPV